jgi:uncharacterized damage-inducible protein DinB
MTSGVLGRIVEHNNWATRHRSAPAPRSRRSTWRRPRSPRERTIRQILAHLVEAQVGYASMLSPDSRLSADLGASLEGLARAAGDSGKGLQAVADGEAAVRWESDLRTSDGCVVKPWTVFVQANGTEHRRQVCSILRALGVEPPRLDGWGFGEATGAVVQAPA